MKSQGGTGHDPQPKGPGRPVSKGHRSTVAALVAVVALVALLLWISQSILAHNRLQNCIDSGRRNCLPVETGGD